MISAPLSRPNTTLGAFVPATANEHLTTRPRKGTRADWRSFSAWPSHWRGWNYDRHDAHFQDAGGQQWYFRPATTQ